MKRLMRVIGKVLKWLGLGTLALVVAFVIGANLYAAYGRYKLNRDFPPPGRLVSVGSHRMHIHCVGMGEPTVVLDAGGGGFSVQWAGVMERAQTLSRICAFDRSGMGWSERSSDPPSAASREADLEALLAVSGESAPFILVGHSVGGELAWLYAQNHPDQIVGLIAVDTVPPSMRDIEAIREFNQIGEIRGWQRALILAIERLGLVPFLLRGNDIEFEDFPPWANEVMKRSNFLSKGMISEQLSMYSLGLTARDMDSLGDLPLTVIRHGICGIMCESWGERSGDFERMWREAQRGLSELSSNGRLLVAEESDHTIPTTQPDIVVDAIREMTEEYRAYR